MPRKQYHREPHLLDAGRLGHIEGLALSDESQQPQASVCTYFGGLPYALPPVGPYRFRKARPLPESFRYGTKTSPGRYNHGTAVCPQPGPGGPHKQTSWDENNLQTNLYIPPGRPPASGWPVFFYIHGGFLQWGDPNWDPDSVAPLLSETAFKCIIVAPAYRLNAFGFLASRELQAEAKQNGEPVGNQGFWDQRLALEWTFENIDVFSGNRSNITVGGYSAGSHSAYQQLAHELYFVPDHKAIIKRVVMWSNSPGVQPKSLPEHQKQFDELLTALNIPLTLSAREKIQQLRAVSAQALVAVQDGMKIHEFRGLTDDAFVSKDVIANINNGDFGRRMKARGIKLMNGECRDEHFVYRVWRTPGNSYKAIFTRLAADYPQQVVRKLMRYYCGESQELPSGMKDWQDAFGKLYANMQVHCLERGFLRGLEKGGLKFGKDVLRYRINWRASGTNSVFPPEWGVTHSTDLAIWFWGLDYGEGLTDEEKRLLAPWNEAFAAFAKGEELPWHTTSVKQMLRLREDGKTDVWEDDQWVAGLKVWEVVNGPEPPMWQRLKSRL